MQKRESLFKYQWQIYNVQSNSYVNHRGLKMRCDNKLFSCLNVVNGKTSPYGSKGIIIHYHYWSDPKIGPGIVAIRIFSCICHACTTILSLSWNSKINKAFIILDMVEHIIAKTLKLLVVTITRI